MANGDSLLGSPANFQLTQNNKAEMSLRKLVRAGLTAVCLCIALVPQKARSWGAGHDDVMRAILDRLPPELTRDFTPEVTKHAIQHSSHYPDSFEPFAENEIGSAAVERLKAAGLKVRYDLHHERGSAMAFIMLVDALRDHDAAHIAHWIAALSHVTADMAACNHDPLVHTATYGWADWKLRLPGGKDFSNLRSLLDLAGSARDTAGGADAFAAAINGMSLHDDDRSARQSLVEIMLYGQEGARYCSARGPSILAGAVDWVTREDHDARAQLWKNIGELGAWAVVRTLRDVEVAVRLAASKERLEITPEVEAGYREGVERILRAHRLEDEALFAPLLRPLKAGSGPVIGIVIEPTWAMNGAMLGFASRVQAAAIMRSLAESQTAYATLDVRRVMADGFPSPQVMPKVILVATAFRTYHTLSADAFDSQLKRYLDQGGRVLWIMGTTQAAPKALAMLPTAMQRMDAKSRLPVADEVFVQAKLTVEGGSGSTFEVAHPAKTSAGWQQPFCPWFFDLSKSPELRPLVSLEVGGHSQVVGVFSVDGKVACLPAYAVTPYLFKGDDLVPEPSAPTLDAPSRAVLDAGLQSLK